MNTPMSLSRSVAALLLGATIALPAFASSEPPPPELAELLPEIERTWGTDPAIVAAVQAQNAKAIPMSTVHDLDERWQMAFEKEDFMVPYLENPVAEAMRALEAKASYVTESFVMDNQGAIVAATQRTSDYWQGDEDKFTESFRDGAGAVHTSAVEFDESADTYLVQVSVPVLSEGKAIGAVTLGVDIGVWGYQ